MESSSAVKLQSNIRKELVYSCGRSYTSHVWLGKVQVYFEEISLLVEMKSTFLCRDHHQLKRHFSNNYVYYRSIFHTVDIHGSTHLLTTLATELETCIRIPHHLNSYL